MFVGVLVYNTERRYSKAANSNVLVGLFVHLICPQLFQREMFLLLEPRRLTDASYQCRANPVSKRSNACLKLPLTHRRLAHPHLAHPRPARRRLAANDRCIGVHHRRGQRGEVIVVLLLRLIVAPIAHPAHPLFAHRRLIRTGSDLD